MVYCPTMNHCKTAGCSNIPNQKHDGGQFDYCLDCTINKGLAMPARSPGWDDDDRQNHCPECGYPRHTMWCSRNLNRTHKLVEPKYY